MVKLNSIAHANFEDYILGIPDGSVDLIATDPPYTDGKGKDVLAGHKIQTVLDLDFIAQQHFRILKPNSFYAFTGQMPSIRAWEDAAYKAGFEWKKQIIWNKKNGNVRQKNQIEDIVENIFVFKKGDPKFNKVSVSYEEQARMNIANGSLVDSVFRQLSYWKGIAKGKELQSTVQPNKQRNDKIYDRGIYERTSKCLGRETGNIKNIWAYSSHNLQFRNAIDGQIKHPTVKPIPLFERLIELCSFDNATVFDGFGGSGTTYLACKRTNRNFYGCEIHADYHQIITDRLAKEDKIINSTLKF